MTVGNLHLAFGICLGSLCARSLCLPILKRCQIKGLPLGAIRRLATGDRQLLIRFIHIFYIYFSTHSNTKLSANTISSALNSHGYGGGSNGYSNGNSTPAPAPVSVDYASSCSHLDVNCFPALAKTMSDTQRNTDIYGYRHRRGKGTRFHLKLLQFYHIARKNVCINSAHFARSSSDIC